IASEVYPFAKTGGLADVAAALPAALKDLGIDVRLPVPGDPQPLEQASDAQEILRFDNPLGCGEVRLLETRLPQADVPVWLVACPALYYRPGGRYQTETGEDWPDNPLRFALLNHVAAALAGKAGRAWTPDLVHAN